MHFKVRTVICVHKNRDSVQQLIMSVRYGFYQFVQRTFGTDFEEGQTTTLRPYRTDFVQSFIGTEIKTDCCVGFLGSLACFSRWSYSH
jgi:hypothetical protein